MQPVTMMDIMPTLLDIAQLPIPDNLDGVSIANLLNGTSTADPHDYIYMWREHVLYAIRGGPWKAHFWTRYVLALYLCLHVSL
jgi:arylsulfatase A